MRIMFVTGIHGVGKTSLCNKLSSELGIPFLVASEFIRKAKGQKEPLSALNAEIDSNARLFQNAILKQSNTYDRLIVDGHTVLLTEEGYPHQVAFEVYSGLPIDTFLIVYSEIDAVAARLKQRGMTMSLDAIADFQDQELRYAVRVAAQQRADVVVADTAEPMESISMRIRRTRFWLEST